MATWKARSTETCTIQAGEQKEVRQKWEMSRGLIGALQREVRSQEGCTEELQDQVEDWWQKYLHAEQLAQELRDKLCENHVQIAENGKVIALEMEKVKADVANYQALCEQNLSLERELEDGTREHDRLQAQLQSAEAEKEHLGEQKQSLKTEVRASTEKCVELQARWQEVEKEKDQLGEEIQSLKTLLKKSTARERAWRGEIEQQPVQATQIQSERLTAISKQLEEHASKAKVGCKEHLQELESLKEVLLDTEKLIETAQPTLLKVLRYQEQPSTVGVGTPREREETRQQEKYTRRGALSGVDPTMIWEEIISTVMECLDQKWGQWVSQYTEDMICLGEKLEKLVSQYDAGRGAIPKQGQQMEGDKGDMALVQESEQVSGRNKNSDLSYHSHIQKEQHPKQKGQRPKTAPALVYGRTDPVSEGGRAAEA
ncbi:myosin-4-like [Alligator mississippiensis]|uniref:myosin-4-like n=1 Tax=Alligator mississippiensis TaxID=8496 RepID=UPI00287778B9|nr:myosin-4-like [Alligator mississippiensis]